MTNVSPLLFFFSKIREMVAELEIRKKLIQSGAVDVMVSVGPNFFYTVSGQRYSATKNKIFGDTLMKSVTKFCG